MFLRKFILPKLVKEVVKELTVSDPNDTIFDDLENAIKGRIRKRKSKRGEPLTSDEIGDVLTERNSTIGDD